MDEAYTRAALLSTGRPESLGEHTRDELYNLAKEMNSEGRSRMDRDELVRAIRKNS